MKPFFDSFSYSDADIKAKIRNLRTQYGKELGKVRASVASGAGTNSVYEPTWRFYDSLHFLRDSITPVKTKPTSGVPEVNVTDFASELASSEVPVAPSGCINNNDDNECIINDLGELNDEEDETSISRPFDILTQSQNDPGKSAKSKAKVREKMENTVLQKSLVVLDKLATKRKRTEELDADETFGMHVAYSLRQIEDRRTKELVKLKIQQLFFNAEFNGPDQMPSSSWTSESQRLMF